MTNSYDIAFEGETIEVDVDAIEKLFGYVFEDEPEEDKKTVMESIAVDLHDLPYLIVAARCLGLNVGGLGLGINDDEYPTTTEKLKRVLLEDKNVSLHYFSSIVLGYEDVIRNYILSTNHDALANGVEHVICVLPTEAQGWIKRSFGNFASFDLGEKYDLNTRP